VCCCWYGTAHELRRGDATRFSCCDAFSASTRGNPCLEHDSRSAPPIRDPRAALPPNLPVGRGANRQRIKLRVARRMEFGSEIRALHCQRSISRYAGAGDRTPLQGTSGIAAPATRPVGHGGLPAVPAGCAAPPELPLRRGGESRRLQVLVQGRVELGHYVRTQPDERSPLRRLPRRS
jgi:hypothetical protein